MSGGILVAGEACAANRNGGFEPFVTTFHEAGRAAVFTPECDLHLCLTAFMNWPGYCQLWSRLGARQ